jgi:hypothetical protein
MLRAAAHGRSWPSQRVERDAGSCQGQYATSDVAAIEKQIGRVRAGTCCLSLLQMAVFSTGIVLTDVVLTTSGNIRTCTCGEWAA